MGADDLELERQPLAAPAPDFSSENGFSARAIDRGLEASRPLACGVRFGAVEDPGPPIGQLRPLARSPQRSREQWLRVLFAHRRDVDAGDEVATVMRETAAALSALGVQVDVTLDMRPDVSGYDLVQAFSIWHPKTALEQLRHLRETGLPLVWLPLSLNRCGVAWPRFRVDLSEMVSLADHVCAISHREMQVLFQTARLSSKPVTITPHGVDPALFDASPDPFRSRFDLPEPVLCVGAVEPRQNQLTLVRALAGTGLPVVLVGPCPEPEYLELCLREGGDGVLHFDSLPRELVVSAYKAARVHALPSFGEGVSLASLEAGAAGCAVVVSNRSSELEYFGDLAYFSDPSDPASIRSAVLEAVERRPAQRERGKAIAERLRAYTWERTARATLDAYERALQNERKTVRREVTRRLAGLAFADELLEAPELLMAYARTFGAAEDATLVIYAPGSVDRIGALVSSLGLDDVSGLIAVGVQVGGEAELAAMADYVLSRRSRDGPLATLPRFDERASDELRRFATGLGLAA